jgi:hypothetical protein
VGSAARALHSGRGMSDKNPNENERGKVGWALAWILGIPLPILLVVYLVTRAC